MFVPFRDESGRLALRPAFIGFIKNDSCRRFAMLLMYPLTLAATFAFNYLLATLRFLVEVLQLTVTHAKILKRMPWDSDVWDKPRSNKLQ